MEMVKLDMTLKQTEFENLIVTWTLAQRIDFYIDLLRQIAVLHRMKITHCDLKEDNIGYHNGRPVIFDFGLAREGKACGGGTRRTMAPEVMFHLPSKEFIKSDVYSLAVVIINLENVTAKISPVIRSLNEDSSDFADYRLKLSSVIQQIINMPISNCDHVLSAVFTRKFKNVLVEMLNEESARIDTNAVIERFQDIKMLLNSNHSNYADPFLLSMPI
jgi:serine/threonine protein kinase